MAREVNDLLLFALTLYKEAFVNYLPADLGLALAYFYKASTGVTLWAGYALAAVYYLSGQAEGDTFCEMSGYLYTFINALFKIINFSG